MRKTYALGASVAVAIGMLGTAGAVPASAGGTVTACVKKKTGKTVLVSSKKKCKKGWKKVTWNNQGPQGASGSPGVQGPVGPNKQVIDATGRVMGTLLGVASPSWLQLEILIDGGQYYFTGDGRLLSVNRPVYTNNTCSSPPYVNAATGAETLRTVGYVNGPFRWVSRVISSDYGPASAFKLATTDYTSVSGQDLYVQNQNGACNNYWVSFTGNLFPLTPIPAPADGVGPLTFS